MEKVTILTIIGLTAIVLLGIKYTVPDLWNTKSDDLIINAVGAFLGFLGGYIIYITQTTATEKGNKEAELKKHKEHLRYFAGIMLDVIRYAKNQADELDKVSKAIEVQPSVIHQLAFIASGSVDRLNRADNESAFHAYNTLLADNNQHEVNYKNILSQTDLLTAQLAAVKQTFVHYRENIYDRQLKLKSLIQNIADETAFLLRDIRKNGQAKTFKEYAPTAPNELNNIILNYVDLNSLLVPFEKYFDEFIEPLKHWLHDNDDYILLEGEVRQRTLTLVRLTKGASTSFKDLKDNALDFLPAFDSQRLRRSSENLEELLKELNRVAN